MPEFTDSGGAISDADIADAEKKLEVTFPADYRSFLLKVNGGIPKPGTFLNPALADDDEDEECDDEADVDGSIVEMLYTLGDQKAGFNHYDLVTMNLHFRSELELPTQRLAVGLYDEMDVLLVSVGERDRGAVYAWSFIASGYDEDRVDRIADSFDEFLKLLDA